MTRKPPQTERYPGAEVPFADEVPRGSESALALAFAEEHRNDLRYCAAFGEWLIWVRVRWAPDETHRVRDLVHQLVRREVGSLENERQRSRVASASTVAAVEKLAQADRRLAATAEQWDAYPMLLATPRGVVDLSTGLLRPADPGLYMTKLTAVTPGGPCPNWLAFLRRITAGDRELEGFLQRVAGYALTGLTSAQAMFFAYGTGANGKSVFLNTLGAILGDYHKTAPIETFTAATNDRHPTELAGLRGARLVTSIETEEGRRWAEARIKALTAGDPISARFMRQDFFEFCPQFKLLVAGNHKPGLRTVDEAIRRRLHLVPFSVRIPPEERDEALAEKLKAEWGGILAWAIDGCLEWQRIGLAPPPAVLEATEAYLEAEDTFAAWLDECCERDPDAWQSTTSLFASWKAWCERAGEPAGSDRRLAQALEARNVPKLRKSAARGFQGLRLRDC